VQSSPESPKFSNAFSALLSNPLFPSPVFTSHAPVIGKFYGTTGFGLVLVFFKQNTFSWCAFWSGLILPLATT